MVTALFALVASAEAASVDMDIDSKSLVVGQVVDLAITVHDTGATAVPQIPSNDGLQIAYQSQAANSWWVNGRPGRYVRYLYQVTAVREGTWTIPAVDVEVGTQHFAAGPITVEVGAAPKESEEPLSVEAAFDTVAAWEGQVVVYTYTLKSRVNVLRAQWTLPTFDGLVTPRDGQPDRHQYQIDDPKGALIVDSTSVPLVATGTGKRDQQGAVCRVDVQVDNPRASHDPFSMLFDQARTEVMATGTTELSVQPLPKAPAGFSGLVGDFDVDSKVDATTVKAGGSVTWTIHLDGDGTLEGFALPASPSLDGARIYDDSPAVTAKVADGKYRAMGDYTRVIVPTKEGTLDVPPITLVTFSTSKGEYVTTPLQPPEITVLPGDATQVDVQSFGQQANEPAPPPDVVRPIHRDGSDHALRLAPALPFLLGLAAAPGFAKIGILLLGWWRSRPKREPKVAPSTPKDRLARLPQDPKQRLAELDAALREALARKQGVPVTGLDRDRATSSLPQDVRELVLATTRALDRARFAGEELAGDLERRVREVVDRLEIA